MKKSVAIIEDSEIIIELYEKFMEKTFSCEVFMYPNAEEFLKADVKPDLLLLDYFLDKGDPYAMNGLDLLDELKNKGKTIPVIIVSGLSSEHVKEQLREHKIVSFIDKDAPAFWTKLENGIVEAFNK